MTDPVRILRESSLLRGLPPEAVSQIFERNPVRALAHGEPLLSPDQPNQFLYCLLSGSLNVLVGATGSAASVPVQPGQCVGEMSIIDGGRVSAPVVAEDDATLLAIDVDEFWRLTETYPLIARNLLGVLAERMRSTNEALAMSLQLQQAYERWAFLDPLTAVYNRRWLDQTLPRYLDRARRDQLPFTLAVFDIDHFKRFNDNHGHPAGDAALRATVYAVQARMRTADRLARIGGEEFCILLPDTDPPGARIAAARLVRAVADNAIEDNQGKPLPSVTISLGLATATDEMDMAALLAAADAALYRAKHAGRNRYAD
jgi:diguanylate cyclase (GGDEF)-like protein